MKVKLQHIWQLARISEGIIARGELSPIEEIKSGKFPPKRSYWLSKQLDAVSREIANLEQVRIGLIQQHGQKSETQIKIEPGSEAEKAFWDELTPLLEAEIEIPGERFSFEELEAISPNAIGALGFLFTENE